MNKGLRQREDGRRRGLWLWLAACVGCGGAASAGPATHEDFRAIQREEATIEARRADTLEPDTACPDLGRATSEICNASGRICEIAEGTSDADARARCERATRSCDEARARAEARSECAG